MALKFNKNLVYNMLSQGFLSIRRQARFWPSASGTTALGLQNFGAPSIVPLRGFRPNNWSPSAITALQPAWLPSIPSVIPYVNVSSRLRQRNRLLTLAPTPRPRVRDREKPRSHPAETTRSSRRLVSCRKSRSPHLVSLILFSFLAMFTLFFRVNNYITC